MITPRTRFYERSYFVWLVFVGRTYIFKLRSALRRGQRRLISANSAF